MQKKQTNGEMNTNFFSILLAIFLVITAFLLYKNITSPVVSETKHEAETKVEEVKETETVISPQAKH